MATRRRFADGSDSSKSRYSREPDIPYIDAHPDTNEVPLEQLDTFVIPARDEKGASEPRTFHIPPYMNRQIEIIIRSGRFPYLRFADFVRHAIYRHIRWLTSIRATLPKHITIALEATAEVCRQSEHQERMEEVLATLYRRIQHLCDHGHHGEVRRILNLIKTQMDGVEDNYVAQKFNSELERKFYDPFLSVHPQQPQQQATSPDKKQKR